MLPEFLIVGAPKCGTTALAESLGQHPGLFIPERKELSFFDVNWERGAGWFASYFDAARDGQLRCEATPDYFATPIAAERIAETNPTCKLIVLARDPIKRAQSHYWFRWNSGRERRSFDQVIADETASPTALAAGYVVRHGMYGQNLDVYRARFGADLIHIVAFDELVREPARVIEGCQRFLGVAQHELVLEQANAAREPRALPASRAIQWFGHYQGAPKRLLRRLVPDAARKKVRGALLRAVSKPTKNPPLTAATRARLYELYAADSERFHRAVGRSLWVG